MLPPVVECSREAAGPCIKLINDGMHRVYSARAARRPITVVYVAGVPDDTPYYAYPNPRGWEDVRGDRGDLGAVREEALPSRAAPLAVPRLQHRLPQRDGLPAARRGGRSEAEVAGVTFDFTREWPFFPDDEKLRIFDPRANVAS